MKRWHIDPHRLGKCRLVPCSLGVLRVNELGKSESALDQDRLAGVVKRTVPNYELEASADEELLAQFFQPRAHAL